MDRAANTSANIDDNIEPWRLAKYRTDKVHSCYWWLEVFGSVWLCGTQRGELNMRGRVVGYKYNMHAFRT